ncbi:MAG: ATP-binding protein [Candidatus Izimaplasma sp.]|nr:ATP-binding protein [Candidatus Izimaplasma bacterium]
MLKRKVEDYLIKWKNRTKKKCLIVEGPRQIGKTFSINDFAIKNYDEQHYLYVNFLERPDLIGLFDLNLDPSRIYQELRIHFSKNELIKGKSLIFFDEIQECPNAIMALKPLTIDGSYDVISSGSLLGVSYASIKSFPVGYVDRYYMKSLDFEEFLWANGFNNKSIMVLHKHFKNKTEVNSGTHNLLMNVFKEYMVIGGMPEIVTEYLIERDFKKALVMQKNLIDDYRSDIAKYGVGRDVLKARECLESIPLHLFKHYKKLQYKHISKGVRASKYEKNIAWLIDTGILMKSMNVSVPEKPLNGNIRVEAFKLYLHDTGLLVGMLGEGVQIELLKGDWNASNGAVLENVMASMLDKMMMELYYFEKNAKIEVDFLIRYQREITAIEVKSADNVKSKVLNSLIDNYGVKLGMKFGTKNVSIKGNIETYPIYMAMFLKT